MEENDLLQRLLEKGKSERQRRHHDCLCNMFLTTDGRGQQLPGVFRGYPLISPKSGI